MRTRLIVQICNSIRLYRNLYYYFRHFFFLFSVNIMYNLSIIFFSIGVSPIIYILQFYNGSKCFQQLYTFSHFTISPELLMSIYCIVMSNLAASGKRLCMSILI